jgi:hypothetical protein
MSRSITAERKREREGKTKENYSRNENITYARRSNHILTYTYCFLLIDLEYKEIRQRNSLVRTFYLDLFILVSIISKKISQFSIRDN